MKVFYKRPFTRYHPHNQGLSGDFVFFGPLIPNSLLLSRYQRNSGGIYDILPGFKGCKCNPKSGHYPQARHGGEK
jgi:hypothetical protein